MGSAAEEFCILERGKLLVETEVGKRSSAAGATRMKLGEVAEGEGFGESSLLEGKSTRTKAVTCIAPKCEVVRIHAKDFLRLVVKSKVVRESFERLNNQRKESDAYAEDDEMRKFATR